MTAFAEEVDVAAVEPATPCGTSRPTQVVLIRAGERPVLTEAAARFNRSRLLAGVASDDVIVNILARRREPPRPLTIVTPEDLALRHPPRADCNRYDSLRGLHAAA